MLQIGIDAVERGLVPDVLTRAAIRRLCRARLLKSDQGETEQAPGVQQAFVESMRHGPIAPVPEKANQQHYELPPEFFSTILGPRRKYSCCYFANVDSTLAQAEETALIATCARAQLSNGQDILELGCGWGSLSLWIAEQFPGSRITAVSNAAPQRRFIELEARRRGLGNLRIVTADMNDFAPRSNQFDRVVSVEMFEHMRNYEQLLARIASWLRPAGKLFVHIFCHRRLAYAFESDGAANWMGQHFFTGGIMPSSDLLQRFNRDMIVTGQWTWPGIHYQRTCAAWLANMDARRNEVHSILVSTYGSNHAWRWLNRWRTFFLSGAELFGYARGREWCVSHYLLEQAV